MEKKDIATNRRREARRTTDGKINQKEQIQPKPTDPTKGDRKVLTTACQPFPTGNEEPTNIEGEEARTGRREEEPAKIAGNGSNQNPRKSILPKIKRGIAGGGRRARSLRNWPRKPKTRLISPTQTNQKRREGSHQKARGEQPTSRLLGCFTVAVSRWRAYQLARASERHRRGKKRARRREGVIRGVERVPLDLGLKGSLFKIKTLARLNNSFAVIMGRLGNKVRSWSDLGRPEWSTHI